MRTVEGNVELFKRKSVTHGNLRVFPSQKIHQLQVSAVSISFWVYPCCVLGRWYYYGNRWFFETPKKTEQIDSNIFQSLPKPSSVEFQAAVAPVWKWKCWAVGAAQTFATSLWRGMWEKTKRKRVVNPWVILMPPLVPVGSNLMLKCMGCFVDGFFTKKCMQVWVGPGLVSYNKFVCFTDSNPMV